MSPPRIPGVVRLLDRVRTYGPDECWPWYGDLNDTRYGKITVDRVTHRAHRYSYEHFVGEIPDGLYVCHTCDHKSCVNPAHLFLGTNHDNQVDAVRKGIHRATSGAEHYNAKKDHCPKGHLYDEVNTYIPPRGGRHCRECIRTTNREYARRRRAMLRAEVA